MKDGGTLPGWPLLLRRERAAAFLDLSPSTFDSAAKDPAFPKPIPLIGSVRAWHRQDLEAWAEDRRMAAGFGANEWDAAS